MESHVSTTPFGRRRVSLAHVATQIVAKERPPDATAHKWTVFRAICEAKERLGLTDRALAVLNALLSFHPETALSGDNLVVFPSNEQLRLRAPTESRRRRCAAAWRPSSTPG
jgi:replication initiation protein RepC